VPSSYEPKTGPNRWQSDATLTTQVEAMLRTFDTDRDYIITAEELHALLLRTDPSITREQSADIYRQMLASGYDVNGDGHIAIHELASYWASHAPEMSLAFVEKMPATWSPAKAEVGAPSKSFPKIAVEAVRPEDLPPPSADPVEVVYAPNSPDNVPNKPNDDDFRQLSDRIFGMFAPQAGPPGAAPEVATKAPAPASAAAAAVKDEQSNLNA